MKMIKKPIRLIFRDLLRKGEKVDSEEYVEMTTVMIRAGSATFNGVITLPEEGMDHLNKMFEAGLQPVFWISPIWDTRRDEKDVSENDDHR